MGGNQFCNFRVADRLKGILAEGTFRYGNLADVVNSLFGYPADLRKGRNEKQLLFSACFKRRRQLRADVAPKRGICFFIDIAHTGLTGPVGKTRYNFIGLFGREMTGFRIYYQHGCVMSGKIHIRIYHYLCLNSPGGKLYPCIQRTGKVVCND